MEITLMEYISAILSLLALILVFFTRSYAKEKGKNQATKEDIKEITEKVEGVRAAHERTNHVSKFEFEKEYSLYEKLWEALLQLSTATGGLRPQIDSRDPKETEEEIKKRRLQTYIKAIVRFDKLFKGKRPFYPQNIFDKLIELESLCQSEKIDYEIGYEGERWTEYWSEAKENAEKLKTLTEDICKIIRKRIEEHKTGF